MPNRAKNTLTSVAWRVGRQLKRKFTTQLCWMHLVGDDWETCDETTQGAVKGIYVRREA